MENGSIASKDIISWGVGLVPLLIFYLEYRIYKKQSNKKIESLEEMLYKEIIVRKDEIIARKDLKIKELEKENQKLNKENKELKKRGINDIKIGRQKKKLGGN